MDAETSRKIRGGANPKPFRTRKLRRVNRPPRYWNYVTDTDADSYGWRQVTQAEAVFIVVLEMLDEGEIETSCPEEREQIAEIFRRRAGVDVSLPQLATMLGISKQRAHQMVTASRKKIERAAELDAMYATPKTRGRVLPAKSLREHAA